MKSTGDRLGRREKTKWEISGTGKNVKQRHRYFFYSGGYRIVNS